MMKTGVFLLMAAAALAAAGPATAGENRFDLRLGAGMLSGDSTYTIGGAVRDNQGTSGYTHNPLSELKWPLNVALVSVGARADIGRFSLGAEYATSVTSGAGDMEDSDWGVYYDMSGGNPMFSQYSKDIFSTSTTDLSAWTVDVRGRYHPWQGARFSTGVGLGLRYQKFSVVASDLFQYSPSFSMYNLQNYFPSDPFAAMVSGPVIEYEVSYTIPYVELSGLYRFGPLLSLEGSLGYSPLVSAKDRDDHLLRYKLNESTDTGSAWLFELALRLQATKHWFVSAGVSGLFIDTSGTQHQSFYAGEYAGYEITIDQTLTSSQLCGSLQVGCSF
jgi:outer membrane protease